MQVSNSKLKTYRRCPNKYRYKYRLKLRPKQKKVQLERGTWIHALLMVHNDGHDWKDKHQALAREFKGLVSNLTLEDREELGDLPGECGRIMRAYLHRYRNDDRRYVVVDTEMDEVITLPNGLRLNIIVDKIVEDKQLNGLFAVDYKTRAKFADVDSKMMDPQLTLYYWGLEKMGYTPLLGTVVDEIRTKAPTIPKITKRGHLSRRMDIDTDVLTYMREIRRYDLDPRDYAEILQHLARNQHDKFFRRTTMPKDPPLIRTVMREAVQTAQQIAADEARDRFPRTFDTSCRWQCEFKDICLTELYGGNIEPLVKDRFEVSTRGE